MKERLSKADSRSAKYMPCFLLHVVGIKGGRSGAALLKNLPKKLLITNLDSFFLFCCCKNLTYASA